MRSRTVGALLGRRIRALRKLRGLSQEALGARADVTGKFVGIIERGSGNPSIAVLHRIADALRLDLSELVRFEEDAPSGPVARAAAHTAAAEKVSEYLSRQSAEQVERALRILEAALGDAPDAPEAASPRRRRA